MPRIPTLYRLQQWFQRVPLFRSRRNLLILGVVVVLVLFLWSLLRPNRTEPTVTPPALQSPTGSEGQIDLTLSAPWPGYPDTLNEYQLTAYTPVSDGAKAWAEQLGLPPIGRTGRGYLDSNRNIMIAIAPGDQSVKFTHPLSDDTPSTRVNAVVAREHLDSFLQNLGFQPSEFQVDLTLLGPADEESDHTHEATDEHAVDPSEATIVQFSLQPTLNSAPLRWEAGNVDRFLVFANNERVTNATLPYFPIQTTESGVKRTKTQAAVIESIQSGGYVIVGTVGRGQEREKLQHLEVQSIEVEYRISSTTQTVAPFLLLSGQGTFVDGQVFETQITTPLTQ